MLTATCHCGAIRLEMPRKPRSVTRCNCSICHRYAALWAYFSADVVRIRYARKSKQGYVRENGHLRFVRCALCGCVTHWETFGPDARGRVGVNMRNVEPAVLATIRVRHLDGADSWRYLD